MAHVALLGALACGSGAMTNDRINTLSADERAEGWRLLFDGDTLQGWRGFRSESPPPGWNVADGVLVRESSGGDLLTVDRFGDFDLRLEWRISEGGNSGIFFHVTLEGEQIWETGPEFQVLDNAGHRDGRDPVTSAGANYGLHAPARDATRPPGEWNEARIVVRHPRVEHWLNGVKVVEYELGSADWNARVRASKFATMPRYGRNRSGHIALQDHGDLVWYRHIRIRPL